MWPAAASIAVTCLLGAGVRAQDAAIPNAASRPITITVGTPSGSPASLYAQALARHLGRLLPGHPSVIVQHLPGAGGLLAANTAYNTMARDGSALVTTNSAIFLEPLLVGKGAQFDARRFTWIGGTHVERMLCVTWSTSKVKTLQDAIAQPAIIGSYGAEGPSAVLARAANRLAGTRFTLITGYSGGPEALIAMEREEVEGNCALGWQELSRRNNDWLKEHKVNLLFQMGLARDPEIPDVPLLLDHARSELDQAAMRLLFTPLEMGRPIYAPPGLHADAARDLRAALGQTLQDSRFLADAEQSGLPITHVGAERIAALLDEVYTAAPEIIARARLIGN